MLISMLLIHSPWDSGVFAITVVLLALLVFSVFRDVYDKKNSWDLVCSTCSVQKKLLLRASILFTYRMNKALKLTNNSLKLFVLEMLDQPLGISISMFMFMLL